MSVWNLFVTVHAFATTLEYPVEKTLNQAIAFPCLPNSECHAK